MVIMMSKQERECDKEVERKSELKRKRVGRKIKEKKKEKEKEMMKQKGRISGRSTSSDKWPRGFDSAVGGRVLQSIICQSLDMFIYNREHFSSV